MCLVIYCHIVFNKTLYQKVVDNKRIKFCQAKDCTIQFIDSNSINKTILLLNKNNLLNLRY